jgi:hypothetical protein
MEMEMDRYHEYIEWLLPDKEGNDDEIIDEKRKNYVEYSNKRKKTFADIMGRVKKIKEKRSKRGR